LFYLHVHLIICSCVLHTLILDCSRECGEY